MESQSLCHPCHPPGALALALMGHVEGSSAEFKMATPPGRSLYRGNARLVMGILAAGDHSVSSKKSLGVTLPPVISTIRSITSRPGQNWP